MGCLTARALSRRGLKVCVLESCSDVAEGATKANSAIVHAGFDAKPGSLKAKFNVQGNALYERLCRDLHVPFSCCGSLVLAFGAEDEKTLLRLRENARLNDVPVEILLRDEIARREPNVSDRATAALWAPTGGICCPYDLTFRAAENAAANGAQFVFDVPVVGFMRTRDHWEVITAEESVYIADCVINCAGTHSDELNNLVSSRKYHITARKGEYLMLDKYEQKVVSSTIFRCPTVMGKGILVSPTVDGTVIIGPTAEDMDHKDDVATTSTELKRIEDEVQTIIPGISFRKSVITEFAGNRAHEDGGDFIIGEVEDAPGFFNALGIESPGLTAAPAIAEFLAARVRQRFNREEARDFVPSDDVGLWPVPRQMDDAALGELVKRDPSFGHVICRCETVTEGEIRAAIRCRVGARTLDGLKRRTRAQMGRCQGGFCLPKLIQILAEELGRDPTEILAAKRRALV